MQQFKSKTAGWFSIPEQARQTDRQLSIQNAVQAAIHQLSGVQDDPNIAQIISQLRTLIGPR